MNLSLDRQSEFSYSLFSLYVQIEDYQNILILRWSIEFPQQNINQSETGVSDKTGRKCKHFKKEKSFQDEPNKTNFFLEGESSTLIYWNLKIRLVVIYTEQSINYSLCRQEPRIFPGIFCFITKTSRFIPPYFTFC